MRPRLSREIAAAEPRKGKPRRGRPRKITGTAETERVILNALKMGLGMRTAAGLVEIDPSTLTRTKERDKRFKLKCDKAVSQGKYVGALRLMEQVQKGNMSAIMFFLRTRTDEFRERETIEVAEYNPDESYL